MKQIPETDKWGSDIALDEYGQAIVAANGELVLTENVATGVQDIRLRLFTYFGTLFYDKNYGSRIFDYIYEENTQETRAAFIAELELCVEQDPRVIPLSVKGAILKWDEKQLVASVRWNFIEHDQPFNLVMQANKNTKELIVQDANPDPASFSADIPQY